MDYAVDVVRIARESGAKIEEYPLELIDGLATRIGGRTFVVLRSSACPLSKRFVLAHELAHLEDGTVSSAYTLIAERRADRMASEKLIPERELFAAVGDYGWDAHFLACLFWVPKYVMERRIKDIFNL